VIYIIKVCEGYGNAPLHSLNGENISNKTDDENLKFGEM
jgi:hypothetical protein